MYPYHIEFNGRMKNIPLSSSGQITVVPDDDRYLAKDTYPYQLPKDTWQQKKRHIAINSINWYIPFHSLLQILQGYRAQVRPSLSGCSHHVHDLRFLHGGVQQSLALISSHVLSFHILLLFLFLLTWLGKCVLTVVCDFKRWYPGQSRAASYSRPHSGWVRLS